MKKFFFQDYRRIKQLVTYIINSDENLYYTTLTVLVGVVAGILLEHALFLSENFLLIPLKILLAIAIIWGFFSGLLAVLLMISGFQLNRPVSFEHLRHLLKRLFEKNWFMTVAYFLFYAVITIPLGGFGFSTVILAHLPTTMTLQNFIFANRWIMGSIFGLLYIGLCWVALRLILALPAMVSRRCSLTQGIRLSWQLTKRKAVKMLGKILLIAIRVSIPIAIFGGIGLWGLSQLNQRIQSIPIGITLMVLAISFAELLFVWWFLVFSTGFLSELNKWVADANLPLSKVPVFQKRAHVYRKWELKQIQQIGLSLLGLLLLITPTYAYFSIHINDSHPLKVLTISHRGVSDRNGVQNTVMALRKTHRLHPDYVEMDIRETEDNQFVAMHDSNLKHLAGRNVAVSDLTLKELTHTTLRENGYQTKVSSFSEYLKVAHRIHQPLIVEIKPSHGDSADLVERFNKAYGKILQQHGDKVHSLDADFMMQLKDKSPKLKTGIITPFNIARIPKNSANFYSLEFHTLNRQFVQQAWAKHKQVFVWPADGTSSIKRMLALRVDGIITNHLSRLQYILKTKNRQQLMQYEVLNNLIELW